MYAFSHPEGCGFVGVDDMFRKSAENHQMQSASDEVEVRGGGGSGVEARKRED